MRQSLYRGDIDGLRAIAVLSVIAFHLSPDDLGGGYLGVDVFFVISGYLITTIIAGEMREGRFSFWDFYARRVRRILRQRADKDIAAAPKIDASEVEEIAALIDFVAVCRTYASELAINEVTLRTYSDLQHYVERSTEAMVQALRGGDPKARAYRQTQAQAAIRFCEILFGHDYASLMSRAAENAVTGERKATKATKAS